MSRGTPIEILTEAADTQHTAALTWRECNQILAHFDYLDAKLDRVRALAADESRHLHRWVDDSCLVDVTDLQAALGGGNS